MAPLLCIAPQACVAARLQIHEEIHQALLAELVCVGARSGGPITAARLGVPARSLVVLCLVVLLRALDGEAVRDAALGAMKKKFMGGMSFAGSKKSPIR